MDILKKSEFYEKSVIKLAKSSLLKQIIEAQETARLAAKKARELYRKLNRL